MISLIFMNYDNYLNCTDYISDRSMCLIDHSIIACSGDLNELMRVLLQHKCKKAKRWLLRILSNYSFRGTDHKISEYIDQTTGFLNIEKAVRDSKEINFN